MKIFVFIFLLLIDKAFAQFSFFEPEGSFAIEVSLENSSLTRLPIYRNSISSLVVAGDNIIGGTKADEGLSPFLFVASIHSKSLTSVIDLNTTIKNQKSIETGFCKSSNGIFYAGTMPNGNNSGHLFSFQMSVDGITSIHDLGSPVNNQGIFSLTLDNKTNTLYGITYPDGIFFSYRLNSKEVVRYNDIVPNAELLNKLQDEFGLKPQEYLCKSLITNNGFVYGSTPVNRIFAFDSKTKKFELYKDSLPDVWGRNVLGQVECWLKGKDGKVYGGNAGDGQLFSLDVANKKVKNLGKPIMATRLRGLASDYKGRVYGIAGALPGYSHLFMYDSVSGFKDYGNPQFTMKAPGLEQGIAWRGFQLGTITASQDGKYIVMGEDESLSQLLVFPVK